MRRHWPYVAITGVLAVVVAVWAVPRLGDDTWFGYQGAGTPGAPPLPDLAPSLLLLPGAAEVLLLAFGVGLLVQVYSVAYLGRHARYRSYALVVVLFLLGMGAVVASTNLWVVLVGWEVMGLCSYLLIGHEWERPEARAGAAKAFLVTRAADLGLVVAIVVIGETYGTYDVVGAWVAAASDPRHETLIGLLVLVAVVGKSAQFPLQSWLPDAMPGPTPITALIHAATMVAAGVFLAARLFPLYAGSTVAVVAMAFVAAVTMLLGAAMAWVQSDLKRALAWSTVSQLAFMFAAIAAADPGAALDHLLAHGVFKALLFLACGCVMHAVGTSALAAMGGLRGSMRLTFWTATIGFAALAGLVPTVGFFTKDSVLAALEHATHCDETLPGVVAWFVLLVALVTSVVTAAYATRLWLTTFLGDRPAEAKAAHEAPPFMTGPLVVLAVAALALSIGQPVHLGIGLLSTALAVLGAAGATAVWRSGRPVADDRLLRLERALDAPFTRWLPRFARSASGEVVVIDADAVDVYPRGVAGGAGLLAVLLDAVQSRDVQRYASVVAVGVVVLVVAAVSWT